jgi:integrase
MGPQIESEETMQDTIKVPKVRMAKPTGRPIQLRYTDPATGKEVRISTNTYDPAMAAIHKAKLEAKLLLGMDAKPRKKSGAGRFGWVFNPMSLQTRLGRSVRHQRPSAEWVGKVVSAIGKAAGVVVQSAKDGGKPKYASAHDLRRSCAERLVLSGIDERDVARVLRHADVQTTRRFYAPGTVQQSAAVIRRKLAVCT